MANEIEIIQSIKVTNGAFRYPDSDTRRRKFDQAAQGGGVPGTIVAAIADAPNGTAISLSALTTPGWIRVKNLDGTNFVDVGVWTGAAFVSFARLQPGADIASGFEGMEIIFPSTPGTTYHLLADTADALVLVEAFES